MKFTIFMGTHCTIDIHLSRVENIRVYHPNCRKQRGTKKPLDEGERGE